jgi:NAD(P)-dependent dehydrogenase (short-subunit alcohol dehydrogenase family)
MTTPSAFDRRSLAGRLVLITGAGSGIGRATAYAFAEAGARLVLVDRDAKAGDRSAEFCRLLGASARARPADVGDSAAMEALFVEVAAQDGVVDVLVNNAGMGMAGKFLDTPPEAWREIMDVNFWGVIHGCRLFGRQMVERAQGGHIVNVASAAAFQPLQSLSAYCTSKASVLMLSECLRLELACENIGVTAVCPGIVATNITRNTRFVGQDDKGQDAWRSLATQFYARRNFPPEAVAKAIVKAVRQNQDVVSVTPEAQLTHGLARFAPYVLRLLTGMDALALGKEER